MGHYSLPAWLPPLPGQPWTPIPSPTAPTRATRARSPHPPTRPTPSLRVLRPRDQMIEASLKDRWYILGQTGSGKTRFAKRLIAELLTIYPRTNLYILDSKGDEFPGWPGMVPEQEPPPPLVGDGRVQIWQPPDETGADYESWLEGIKQTPGPAILLIDELSSMGRGSYNSYPSAYARLLKQGRSLNKCVITLTQESADAPRQSSKQTTHFCAFSLSQDDEHAKAQVCKLMGWPLPPRGTPINTPAHKYGFFYRRMQPQPGPVDEYSGYQEFFG